MKARVIVIVLAALTQCFVAFGQPLPYAQSRRSINAGTLLIESQRVGAPPGVPANIAPHLWYNLDQDRSIKPASWTFTNPLGQTLLTAEASNRWGNPLPVGSQIGKASAPYWEVLLNSASDDVLSRFDVLNLTVNGTLSLNPTERERLRRYLDQGGILWVDLVNDASLTLDLINGLPYGFDWAVSALPVEANLLHPLMRSPNVVSLNDLGSMSYANVLAAAVTTPVDTSGLAIATLASWVMPDSLRLEAVAGNADGRTVSAAQIGEGYLVVTARGVTATLNRGLFAGAPPPRVPQVNRGFLGLEPALDGQFTSAAKFAINVVSLATQFSTTGAGSRKSGSTSVTVEAPMLRRFAADFGAPTFLPGRSPVIYKGYIVVTGGGRVSVFDADPARDADRDGNPDDGVADTFSSGYDLVWQSQLLGGALSPPTVVETPGSAIANGATGQPAIDQIWVTDDQSNVYVFDLNDVGGLNRPPLAPSPIAPPNAEAPLADPNGPYAPTVHEGLVFIADSRAIDNLGRVWVVDANNALRVTTGADWNFRGDSFLNPCGASPTVGYIPVQDSPGALDRVAYLLQQPTTIGSPRPAELTSLWIGARGERPVRVNLTSPTTVRIATRAAQQSLPIVYAGPSSSLGLKVTLLKPTGDPFTTSEMQTVFTGLVTDPGTRGEFIVELTATPGSWDWDGQGTPGDTTDDVGWRVDYTIDWGQIGVFAGPQARAYVRGNIEFPDTATNTRVVVGNAALGPKGNLFVVTGAAGATEVGSTLFNLKETNRGDFRLVYRYDLYDQLTFQLNNGTNPADAVNMPASIVDQDGVITDFPILNVPIRYMKFVGGPVVRGDTVYCAAVGEKLPGVFASALLAFEADPGPLEMEIEGADTAFSLVQPDISRSINKVLPTTMSTVPNRVFTAEVLPGNKVRVILDNAMSVTRGRIADSISSSLPVIVRRAGVTDALIEPEAPDRTAYNANPGGARGKFNPLLWYTVMNGFRATTPPIVAGETAFLGGASVLPSFIASGPLAIVEQGLLFAIDAQVSFSDQFLVSNSVRNWHQQLWMGMKRSASVGDIAFADAYRWPRLKDTADLDEFRVRLLQAALSEPAANSLAVGDGSLATTGDQKLYGFAATDFIVVDEGRVSKFDPSGNPLWSASQTINSGEGQSVSGASSGVRLSRPTRMYPDPSSTGAFWLVDSGNDRVVLVDASGRETRTVTGFKLDPAFVPQGMGDAEARTLRDPRDVYVFETRVAAANNPMTNPRPLELWRNIVVAESGHNRVVQIVDRYELDAAGRVIGIVNYMDPNEGLQQALGVLAWHTPEELSGKRYTYNSIAYALVDDGLGGKRRAVTLGFGNVEPGRATFGLDSAPQDLDNPSGYGGVVIYDGPNTSVITSFSVPAQPAGIYLEETAPGSGTYDYLSAAVAAQPKHKIAGLRSVSVRYTDTVYGPRLAVMICEATGIYEVVQSDLADPDSWTVVWMLTNRAYVGMRRPNVAAPYALANIGSNPTRLSAQYARRLESGEILVVNGYVGALLDGTEFNGEVFLLDGTIGGVGGDPGFDPTRTNTGFNSMSVVYELPPVQGIRGIVRPVYAERK